MNQTLLLQVYTLNVFNVTLKVPFVKQCIAIGKLKRYLRNQFRFLFAMEIFFIFFSYPSFNHIQSSRQEGTAENVVQGPVIRGPTEFLFCIAYSLALGER